MDAGFRLTNDAWSTLRDVRVFKDIWILGRANCRRVSATAVLLVWLSMSVLPLLVFGITSHFEHTSRLAGDSSGLFEDVVFLALMFYFPLQFTLALVYFPRLTSTLHCLTRVIRRSQGSAPKAASAEGDSPGRVTVEEFNGMLATCERWITGHGRLKALKVGAILVGLIWALGSARTHWYWEGSYDHDFWSTRSYPLNFWLRTAFEVLLYGVAFPLLIYKLVAILLSIRHLTQQLARMGVLKLRPLNPDKAAGLGELGRFSLCVSILLLPPLLPIVAYILALSPNVLIVAGISLYVPLLVITFFFPLGGLHDAMSSIKKKELETLSDTFNHTYERYLSHLRGDDSKSLDDVGALRDLTELYDRADKMPVWPFDTTTIAKFASILIALLSSVLISYVQGVVNGR